MGSQLLIKQDVKTVNFKTHISVFVASRVRRSYLWLMSYTGFNNDVFNSVKHLVIVNTIFLEEISELHEIPL